MLENKQDSQRPTSRPSGHRDSGSQCGTGGTHQIRKLTCGQRERVFAKNPPCPGLRRPDGSFHSHWLLFPITLDTTHTHNGAGGEATQHMGQRQKHALLGREFFFSSQYFFLINFWKAFFVVVVFFPPYFPSTDLIRTKKYFADPINFISWKFSPHHGGQRSSLFPG